MPPEYLPTDTLSHEAANGSAVGGAGPSRYSLALRLLLRRGGGCYGWSVGRVVMYVKVILQYFFSSLV